MKQVGSVNLLTCCMMLKSMTTLTKGTLQNGCSCVLCELGFQCMRDTDIVSASVKQIGVEIGDDGYKKGRRN
jgi:hypothetical protein